MANATVSAYLSHPTRTRVVTAGIVRLGLVETVIFERDRFANVLAERTFALLPQCDPNDIRIRMRLVTDGAMGIISSELYRPQKRPLEAVARDVELLALAVLKAPDGTPSTPARG